MPISVPVPSRSPGDLLTSALWNAQVKDNINKLLDRGHRVLTVAQFNALTGLEDGDEVYVEVDSTNGVEWHLRYHLATTKWRFLGGPPMRNEIVTNESTTSTSMVDLATVGPSITTPAFTVAVDYECDLKATSAAPTRAGLKIGAAATPDDLSNSTANSLEMAMYYRIIAPAVAASTVLKIQYRSVDGASRAHLKRGLYVTPLRVG